MGSLNTSAEPQGKPNSARFAPLCPGYLDAMVPGIVLLIIGAVFTFALRTDGSWINTRVLGLILMLGGVAFIARARVRRRAVVVREIGDDSGERRVEEREVIEERLE
jgi:hypothetical protein